MHSRGGQGTLRGGVGSVGVGGGVGGGGGAGLEENLLRQLTALRGEYFSLGDLTAGRMPLAYVQLVQVRPDRP